MDEERALRIVEQELDAALGGMAAPPRFAANVLRRTRERQPGYLPEVLDLIGFVAVLVIACVLLMPFAEALQNVWWAAGVCGAIFVSALWFGIHSIREVGN
jgi:hypothetical protein